jgi:hypothetical protein
VYTGTQIRDLWASLSTGVVLCYTGVLFGVLEGFLHAYAAYEAPQAVYEPLNL